MLTMRRVWVMVLMSPVAFLTPTALGAEPRDASGNAPYSLACFAPGRRDGQLAYEASLLKAIDPKRLSAWHDLVASEPHVAGTPGDLRQVDRLARAFGEMGLEVQTHWFWAYLSSPVSAELSMVSPEAKLLGVANPPVAGDRASEDPRLIPLAWNAFSGSGDVTAGVVYANYGTRADFEKLRELGIDCTGKIALTRFGGNFRGYKAKFAEQAGCAGLIIYTDPADSGYAKGPAYPEGGWATPTQVQCGTLLTSPWPGDPLTPGREATEHADRIDPRDAELPNIPVQPIGWQAAQSILEQMKGEPVADRAPEWQGALPLAYRLTGGDELKVRLHVEQTRGIVKTANVVATLRGSLHPEQKVVIGCHHDAWNHGACDPTCGLILVLECARVMSELAAGGHRPERSVVFAGWGAEEFGIVGSTEWVEANRESLEAGGVAYINLDMATMGTDFSAGASPQLGTLIFDAARAVPAAPARSTGAFGRPRTTAEPAGDAPTRSVFDAWLSRSRPKEGQPAPTEPTIGDLGGGSDHVGFLCHAMVPSVSMGSGGARGTAYHSNHDTLTWYRAVVGDDYLPAQMNARMTALIAARLARGDTLPMDPRRLAPSLSKHIDRLGKAAAARGLTLSASLLDHPVRLLDAAADKLSEESVESAASGDPARMRSATARLMGIERAWTIKAGLPGRSWFKNAYAATDRDSGYSPWILPIIERVITDATPENTAESQRALDDAVRTYAGLIESMAAGMKEARR